MKRNSDTAQKQAKFVITRVLCFALCLLMTVGLFAGCEKEEEVASPYQFDSSAESLSSCDLAKTSKYLLSWDDDAKAVLLTDNETGKVWSSIGYEAYLAEEDNDNLYSSMSITVSNTTTCKQDIFLSSTISRTGGDIIAEKIKAGVKVTYYFDNVQIAIPVEYTLRKNGLKVSIDSTQVMEDGTNYELVSASIAPFLCSASNSAEDSYLFLPSGAGALMSVNNAPEGERTWSGEVYDRDYACQIERNHNYKSPVRLPVFGVKEGDNALFAIIEGGSESVVVSAQAGNERLGYSGVYATVKFRAEDIYYFASHATGNTTLTTVAEELCDTKFEIGFYPLIGEEANYNSMAKLYQNYLLDKGELEKSEEISNPYSLTFHGGTMISQSVLGVPSTKLVAMTSFTDVKDILEDVTKNIGISPVVRLNDFGDKGLTPATVNGGSNFAKVYGSDKDAKALSSYCNDSGINLFLDFDLVRYNSSGNGFSLSKDVAKNALGTDAEQMFQTPQMLLSEDYIYNVLGRGVLNKALDNAVEKAEKYGINGMSLSTLSKMAYSDHNDAKYYARSGMSEDVAALINKAKESNHSVAASDANAYAAGVADVIFDLEVRNSNEKDFSAMIPFYQMVYAGYKPMYVSALNMADNFDEQLMLAAITGMGIDFSIIDEFIVESNDLGFHSIYSCVYDGNKKLISEILKDKGYIEHYNTLKGSTIEKYTLLENNVSATTFSNGTTVYANHTAYDAESPIGTLKAYEYKIGKEVENNDAEQVEEN